MKKRKKIRRILSLTLIFAILLSTIAYGDNSMRVAVLKDVSGTVKIRKAGGEKLFPAIENAGLVQGDSIITGKGSGAMLIIDSDKEVKIGENTQLVMSELMKSLKDMGDKTTLNLLSGKVLITINKKLVKDAKFEIKTPTAVMGVRGTTLETIVIGNRTFLSVFEGTVNARNTTTDKETNVGALQLAEMSTTSDPNKPIEVKPVDIKTLELFELEALKDNPKLPPELQNQIKEQYDIKMLEEANKPPAPPPTEAPPPEIIYGPTAGAPEPTPGGNQPPAPTGTNQPPAPTGGNSGGGGRDVGGTPTPITGITVTSPLNNAYIGLNNSIQMHAAVVPSNGTHTISWSVTNVTGTATINASTGVLTAGEPGEVEVVARDANTGITGRKHIWIKKTISIVGDVNRVIGDTVNVEVCDSEKNTNPQTIETFTINATRNPQQSGVPIVMTESSVNSGLFTGQIVIGSGQGQILADAGQSVYFEYRYTDWIRIVNNLEIAKYTYAQNEGAVKALLDTAALGGTSNPLELNLISYSALGTAGKNAVAKSLYEIKTSIMDTSSLQEAITTGLLIEKYVNAASASVTRGLLDVNELGLNLGDYVNLDEIGKVAVATGLYGHRSNLYNKISLQSYLDPIIASELIASNERVPITSNMALALDTPAPGGGNSIGVGGTTHTGIIRVINGTTQVTLLGTKTASQTLDNTDAHVVITGTDTQPIIKINTAGIRTGGSIHFAITINETGKRSLVYDITIKVPYTIYIGNMIRVPQVDGVSTVTSDVAEAVEGDIVTLTAVPKADMQLKANSLHVKYMDDMMSASLSGTGPYTFIMPAANVQVSAEFEWIPLPITDFIKTGKTDTTVSFSWSAAEGATSVKIQKSVSGSSIWDDAATSDSSATSATVNDLVGATTYDFRLVVVGGRYPGSYLVSAIKTDPSALIQVCKPTWAKNKITWVNNITNAVGYELQLYKNGAEEGAPIPINNTSTSEYDLTTQMATGGTYTVKIKAVANGTDYLDGPQSEESIIRTGTLGINLGTTVETTPGGSGVKESGTTSVITGNTLKGTLVVNVSDGTMNRDVTLTDVYPENPLMIASEIRAALTADSGTGGVADAGSGGYDISGSGLDIILTQNAATTGSDVTLKVTLKPVFDSTIADTTDPAVVSRVETSDGFVTVDNFGTTVGQMLAVLTSMDGSLQTYSVPGKTDSDILANSDHLLVVAEDGINDRQYVIDIPTKPECLIVDGSVEMLSGGTAVSANNTYEIQITSGKLNPSASTTDLWVYDLPTGLDISASFTTDSIIIEVYGTAVTPVSGPITVQFVVKGSALDGTGNPNSEVISVTLGVQ